MSDRSIDEFPYVNDLFLAAIVVVVSTVQSYYYRNYIGKAPLFIHTLWGPCIHHRVTQTICA